MWSASWLSLTHQLGSRPHTFVLWPGRPLCRTTCPTIMDCCHGSPPLQLSMTHLSYLAFQKLPLESLLAFWPSSSAQVLILLLDASEEVQLEIVFNGFVLLSADSWNGTRRVGVNYSHCNRYDPGPTAHSNTSFSDQMDNHLERVTRGSPLIFTTHPSSVFKPSFHTVALKYLDIQATLKSVNVLLNVIKIFSWCQGGFIIYYYFFIFAWSTFFLFGTLLSNAVKMF